MITALAAHSVSLSSRGGMRQTDRNEGKQENGVCLRMFWAHLGVVEIVTKERITSEQDTGNREKEQMLICLKFPSTIFL